MTDIPRGIDGPPTHEPEAKKDTFVFSRFTTASRDELRTNLGYRNEWHNPNSRFRIQPLARTNGVHFGSVISGTHETLPQEIKKLYGPLLDENKPMNFIDLGGGIGVDVSASQNTADSFMEHGSSVAEILLQITPDNFHVFQGKIEAVKKVGFKERDYIPVTSFDELRRVEMAIDLERIPPEDLKQLGDNVKIAFYTPDNPNPEYIPYPEFLAKEE